MNGYTEKFDTETGQLDPYCITNHQSTVITKTFYGMMNVLVE